MQTIFQCITWACAELSSRSPTFRLDVDCLMIFVTGLTQAQILTWPEKILAETDIEKFKALVQRRRLGVPIAYLIGKKYFWDLKLKVSADTLIPRAETETLVEFILGQGDFALPKKVLDLGTGSGAIALTLAKACPAWEIWATDFSNAALAVARTNAVANNLTNVNFHFGSYFEGLNLNYFDIICSNPPYLANSDLYLAGEIRYEPRTALVSGDTGLECLEIIIDRAPQYLSSQGWLVVEHGYNQAEAVLKLFNRNFENIKQLIDLNGIIRVTAGSNRPNVKI